MKAKDYIILGSAVAIYLLWKNNKGKKQKTSTNNSEVVSGGSGAGSGSAGSGGATITPKSNEPEQVYGLNLPTGMDLPVLTAGTGVPTEVALQSGLGNTAPTPAFIEPKPRPKNLILDGITPVKEVMEEPKVLQATTINTPRPQATMVIAEP